MAFVKSVAAQRMILAIIQIGALAGGLTTVTSCVATALIEIYMMILRRFIVLTLLLQVYTLKKRLVIIRSYKPVTDAPDILKKTMFAI